jgi:hypothetical protein
MAATPGHQSKHAVVRELVYSSTQLDPLGLVVSRPE